MTNKNRAANLSIYVREDFLEIDIDRCKKEVLGEII